MLKSFIAWLQRDRTPGAADAGTTGTAPPQHDVATPTDDDRGAHAAGFLCREVVLGVDRKVAGYQFMLRQGTRERVRKRDRVVRHAYAEALVRELLRSDVAGGLGSRAIFLDVADSFVGHPCLHELPPGRTVLVVEPHADDRAPPSHEVLAQVRALRAAGLLVGIPDPEIVPELAPLLPESDVVLLRAAGLDPARVGRRRVPLAQLGARARLLVRDLPTVEHADYCTTLGASFFQGPFVTAREDWHDNRLSPDLARIALLLGRLRDDAGNAEVIGLIKQDPAISLRLLRYINAAAGGMSTSVASLDAALQLVGRARLYRWLMILFCSRADNGGRAAASLESALVRGRLMELLAVERPVVEQEAAFLTGLLSLIDVVLQLPMERALASLAAAPPIEAAVVRGEGPYAALLELATACESGEREHIDRCAERCGVSALTASQHNLEALRWALGVQA